MSPTWDDTDPPDPVRIGLLGWLLVLLRGSVLAALVFGCLALLLLVRLVERPLFGLHRPLTPWITRFVCRNAFRVLGMGFATSGTPMTGPGAMVANHSAWLDIFALNARAGIYFASKAEVAGWPGIGWLARATGTLFIERDRRHARAHTDMFRDRLEAGHTLLFFPEGTSTDGQRVLPFKTTLFASFLGAREPEKLRIQPVSVIYHAPPGTDPRFYGWWGDTGFGEGLLKVLAARPQGGVELTYHAPMRVCDFSDRKSLAAAAEAAVRAGFEARSRN